MTGLVGDMYRRSNTVIANFNMCDSQTLFTFSVLFEPMWH